MQHAYLAWLDINGLRGFVPESEANLLSLNRRLEWDQQLAVIWSVVDSSVVEAVNTLLSAALYESAWEYLHSEATHIGRIQSCSSSCVADLATSPL